MGVKFKLSVILNVAFIVKVCFLFLTSLHRGFRQALLTEDHFVGKICKHERDRNLVFRITVYMCAFLFYVDHTSNVLDVVIVTCMRPSPNSPTVHVLSYLLSLLKVKTT